jgi:hypothetical protein
MRGKVAAAVLAAAAVAMVAGCGSLAAPTAGSSASTSAPAVSTSHAPAVQHVTYVVTGTSGAQVTYGPQGSSLDGRVPMHVTRRMSGSPLYYSVQAQLQGGGSVRCKILVNGRTVSSARATGGYNIAMCEISKDPLTGAWQSA